MKLSECKIGEVVITYDGEIGHIVGLQYNVGDEFVRDVPRKDLKFHTIPVVKFPSGQRGIHFGNIKKFDEF